MEEPAQPFDAIATRRRCPNCGATREDVYCPHCGQNDRDYRRSSIPILGELLKESLEIDGRLWRTLGLLFGKPGALSLEFSNNRRARYLSPLRLYLVASLLFFFLLSIKTEFGVVDVGVVEDAPPGQLVEDAPPGAGAAKDAVHWQRFLDGLPEPERRIAERIEAGENPVSRELLRSLAAGRGDPQRASASRWERYLQVRVIRLLDDPRAGLRDLLDNLPVALFILLPAYALLLKVLYWGTGRYYAEHLVYALHLHTVAYVLLSVDLVLPAAAPGTLWDRISGLIAVGLPMGFFAYYYLSLRRYYGQTRTRTLIKFSVLVGAYTVLLGLVAAGAVLLTLGGL